MSRARSQAHGGRRSSLALGSRSVLEGTQLCCNGIRQDGGEGGRLGKRSINYNNNTKQRTVASRSITSFIFISAGTKEPRI